MRHVTVFLQRWRGGNARLWKYAISHKVLTIRVEAAEKSGNLHIFCGDLRFLCGPTGWENAAFEVEVAGPDHMILRDREAGFEAHAGNVEVAENVKPLYR